ncbi:matrixin family metalloprotease [Liquorilactobacillus uvarum]|uniref:matrixin family metalloprotease n=1 Tax=Liquorilactobacillus uvarum TaxID=303240 RepID=UPI00288A2A28|nr:matrixin family metalloprotease [Liquorilactobacillus uvarum]
MKPFRFVKLLFLGVLLAYCFQNPPNIEYGKKWISNKIEQVSSLLEKPQQVPLQESSSSESNSSSTDDSSSNSTSSVNGQDDSQGSSSSTSSSTTSDSASTTGAVWPKNTASVYLDIPANVSSDYRYVWEQALNNWNKFKVFKLVTTNNKAQADIILTTENESNTAQAGVTETRLLINPLTNKKVMTHAVAKLNLYYLNSYSTARKINTAEHELGHAMGLDHVTDHASVMQPQGSDYSIQQSDVDRLKELYK